MSQHLRTWRAISVLVWMPPIGWGAEVLKCDSLVCRVPTEIAVISEIGSCGSSMSRLISTTIGWFEQSLSSNLVWVLQLDWLSSDSTRCASFLLQAKWRLPMGGSKPMAHMTISRLRCDLSARHAYSTTREILAQWFEQSSCTLIIQSNLLHHHNINANREDLCRALMLIRATKQQVNQLPKEQLPFWPVACSCVLRVTLID